MPQLRRNSWPHRPCVCPCAAASTPGVRVQLSPQRNEDLDSDSDDEDFSEVMADLTNPWEPPSAAEEEAAPVAAAGLVPPAVQDVQDVRSAEELRRVLQEEPTLVVLDVRTAEEASAG